MQNCKTGPDSSNWAPAETSVIFIILLGKLPLIEKVHKIWCTRYVQYLKYFLKLKHGNSAGGKGDLLNTGTNLVDRKVNVTRYLHCR